MWRRHKQMPLQISHLKKTKIARTVANLRQHAYAITARLKKSLSILTPSYCVYVLCRNDRVSSKANSLRKVWIQTLSKENPESASLPNYFAREAAV